MGRCQKVPVFAYFEWDLFKIKEALIYLNRLYLHTFDIGSRAYWYWVLGGTAQVYLSQILRGAVFRYFYEAVISLAEQKCSPANRRKL